MTVFKHKKCPYCSQETMNKGRVVCWECGKFMFILSSGLGGASLHIGGSL
jgi:ribosomal protein L37AE/L43A